MSIVIPIENGFAVSVFPLHTRANGYRCRNAGCICALDALTAEVRAEPTPCEEAWCPRKAVNVCAHCAKAICIVHSFGDPASCVDCYYKH